MRVLRTPATLMLVATPSLLPGQLLAPAKAIAAADTNMKTSAELDECKRKQGVLAVKVPSKASKGTPAYNIALSERRARAVVAWLQAHGGLASTSFAVRDWGATKPVAPNTNPDGSDNPAGRQKNRRVEIVIEIART